MIDQQHKAIALKSICNTVVKLYNQTDGFKTEPTSKQKQQMDEIYRKSHNFDIAELYKEKRFEGFREYSRLYKCYMPRIF